MVHSKSLYFECKQQLYNFMEDIGKLKYNSCSKLSVH